MKCFPVKVDIRVRIISALHRQGSALANQQAVTTHEYPSKGQDCEHKPNQRPKPPGKPVELDEVQS